MGSAHGTDLLAERFEEHRAHLRGVAYSIVGTVSDAEDIVQDAWLRMQRADVDAVEDLRAWLTTVVARLALDLLGSARRRRESYVGPWLPEPLVDLPGAAGAPPDPADRITLDESVSLALLVVLETLSPAERTVLLLHDVFGLSFDEVAEVVGRTPVACRQMASRARRHVAARAPRYDTAAAEQRAVVDAFLAAALEGDLEGLVAVLDPEVVLRADGGGQTRTARRPVVGDDDVARFLVGISERGARTATVAVVPVNGLPGLYVVLENGQTLVVGFSVSGGRVTEIDLVANPHKLRHLEPRPSS